MEFAAGPFRSLSNLVALLITPIAQGESEMSISRRWFLGASAAGLVSAAFGSQKKSPSHSADKGVKFKVGLTDWNLRQEGKTDAISLA